MQQRTGAYNLGLACLSDCHHYSKQNRSEPLPNRVPRCPWKRHKSTRASCDCLVQALQTAATPGHTSWTMAATRKHQNLDTHFGNLVAQSPKLRFQGQPIQPPPPQPLKGCYLSCLQCIAGCLLQCSSTHHCSLR